MVQKQEEKPEQQYSPSMGSALLKLDVTDVIVGDMAISFWRASGVNFGIGMDKDTLKDKSWDEKKCIAILEKTDCGRERAEKIFQGIKEFSKIYDDALSLVFELEKKAEKEKDPNKKKQYLLDANIATSRVLLKFEPLISDYAKKYNGLVRLDIARPTLSMHEYAAPLGINLDMLRQSRTWENFSVNKVLEDARSYFKEAVPKKTK